MHTERKWRIAVTTDYPYDPHQTVDLEDHTKDEDGVLFETKNDALLSFKDRYLDREVYFDDGKIDWKMLSPPTTTCCWTEGSGRACYFAIIEEYNACIEDPEDHIAEAEAHIEIARKIAEKLGMAMDEWETPQLYEPFCETCGGARCPDTKRCACNN